MRGKYARRLGAGGTVVVLDPVVARACPDADAVNTALRRLLGRRKPRRTTTR